MTAAPSVPAPQKEGLDKAGDLLKLTLSLATGSLVFGISMIEKQGLILHEARWAIIISWILLALAAASGVLAISAIPIMASKANFDLEDSYLTWPARIHQITFALGIVILGLALSKSLLAAQEGETDQGRSLVHVTYVAYSHDSTCTEGRCCRRCCRTTGTRTDRRISP